VTFSAAASGTAPLSYQWYFNQVTLAGVTNRTLVITNIHLEQVGNYALEISNSEGSIRTAPARLTLLPLTFGTPVSITNLNTASFDGGPTLTANSLTLVFVSSKPGGQGGNDLWMTTRAKVSDVWQEPVNLGPDVNSSSDDAGPSVTADGLTVFFDRSPSGNMWMTKRAAVSDAFGPSTQLPAPVNPNAGLPTISADGLTLCFTSTRSGGYGQEDLWVTKRTGTAEPWGQPENLGSPINSSARDLAAGISRDGLWLFFTSTRSSGYGQEDLWVAHRETTSAPFDEVANLGPDVNTRDRDAKPSFSSNDSLLYFMSTRPGGNGFFDLWRMPVSILPRLKPHGFNQNEEFQLSVTGQAGVAYIIQRSIDLKDWLPLSTNVGPAGFVVDVESPNRPIGFYRVLAE
jgi:Tol biopolymer transport system component